MGFFKTCKRARKKRGIENLQVIDRLADADRMNRQPNFSVSGTKMPPRAVPSSFVMMSPVTPATLRNTSTCVIAFWPVVASST